MFFSQFYQLDTKTSLILAAVCAVAVVVGLIIEKKRGGDGGE